MENTKSLYENESNDEAGLTLRLDYMIEDFLELIQKAEREKLVSEES